MLYAIGIAIWALGAIALYIALARSPRFRQLVARIEGTREPDSGEALMRALAWPLAPALFGLVKFTEALLESKSSIWVERQRDPEPMGFGPGTCLLGLKVTDGKAATVGHLCQLAPDGTVHNASTESAAIGTFAANAAAGEEVAVIVPVPTVPASRDTGQPTE
jgi:hypothetical protein